MSMKKPFVIAATTLAMAFPAYAQDASTSAEAAAQNAEVAAENAADAAASDMGAATQDAAGAAAEAADDAAEAAGDAAAAAADTTGAAADSAADAAADASAVADDAAAEAAQAADAVAGEAQDAADNAAEAADQAETAEAEAAAVTPPDVNAPEISEAQPGVLSSWVTSRRIWTTNEPSSTDWAHPATLEERPAEWQDIAKINDVVLDDSGQVVGYIADIGGFLGIGAKKVLLGVDAIHLVTVGNDTFFATNYTAEELRALPDFDSKTVRS